MKKSTIKSTSIKVMLSYDYCHFESSMSLENESGVQKSEIDSARKDCMRLCDKAVSQYKIAKEMATLRQNGKYKMHNFEQECKKIEMIPEGGRTLDQIAMLKQYSDENWQAQFDYDYDYEDEVEPK